MLRQTLLAGLLGLAALSGLASIAPVAAAGFGAGPGGPGMQGPGWVGRGHPGRGPGFGRGRVRYGAYGYGGGRFGRGGYGGGGYSLPFAAVGASSVSPVVGGENVEVGSYRIVTAPGIVERPPGEPVVYVLNGPGGRDAVGRPPNAGGARIVTLSVPRR